MSLFANSNPSAPDYILKMCLLYLGMRKADESKIKDMQGNEDNQALFKKFLEPSCKTMYLFAIPAGADKVKFQLEVPTLDQIKKKIVLCQRVSQPGRNGEEVHIDEQNCAQEILFMEVNRQILENLYTLCNEVYLPVLGNPANVMDMSELVSKDLMDKFHGFLSYTYVTLGQVKGRTQLPLPPNDVISSEKTSSKDKANHLEQAISHWQKQIKNVLKQDPETALKSGQNPDPTVELAFWKNKSDNLNFICQQLLGERIKKVLKFLEQNKSTYTGPFSKLQKEVQVARVEANDNYLYLQTLSSLFQELSDNSKELSDIQELFVPIMHTILLIWTYSQYYNTPSRLVVLIREICNAVIDRCQNFVDGEKIFAFIKGEEPQEAHNKLQAALNTCTKFKEAYHEYKSKVRGQWKITSNALFMRLDSFQERCHDVMQLTSTILQFKKLDNIAIGNTKGESLSASIQKVFTDFNDAVATFMTVNYDIMDIQQRAFEDDFQKFRNSIMKLERRLASILTQGFDDCDTIIGKFKLLDSFEGLLNRPIIQDELEKKQISLLELYKADLKTVAAIFMEGKPLVDARDERSPISNNLPPIAGALNWTGGLRDRVQQPMNKLNLLSASIQDREEFKDVQKLHSSLCKNIQEYNTAKLKEWKKGVESNTEVHLNKFLLVREPTPIAEEGFIRVNFDPTLECLLREVKYLLLLDQDVPERANSLYEKADIYRTQTGRLEIIANMYNEILKTLLPVEKPLLKSRIEKMDQALQSGIEKLTWNSQSIDKFIAEANSIVSDVDQLVKKMKDNVVKMQNMMGLWLNPLFVRKAKCMPPDELEQTHQSMVMPRHEDIKSHGKDIQKLVKDTTEAIKPEKKSPQWLAYVDYLNSLMIEGVAEGINASMMYLADQISIKYNKLNNNAPMFDIKVDLQDNNLCFDPSIECNDKQTGIRDILQKIIDDFISIAVLVPRLDGTSDRTGDYLVEMKDQFIIYGAMQTIQQNFADIVQATESFIQTYKEKEFLWKEKLSDNFSEFLNSGIDPREQKHVRKNADGEEEEDPTFDWMANRILDGVATKKPSLEEFDQKITFLYRIRNEINDMRHTVEIGWLKVNAAPLIKELQTIIKEWIDTYTEFLLNNTVREINNIDNFIKTVSEGIQVLPDESKIHMQSEKDLLMRVMTHLRDVKMIQERTLNEIEPMKQTVLLLKKHAINMGGVDYLVGLENSKTALVEVSEKALGSVKESILTMQKQEATNLKDKQRDFEKRVFNYRSEFMKALPYNVKEGGDQIIQIAYKTIAEYYTKTIDYEREAAELNNLETLFDIEPIKYKALQDCKNELNNLKVCWDLISLIDYQFASWSTTLWNDIDPDELERLIKNFQTTICNPNNAQNKEIKSWKAFVSLNERVKNMAQVMPLVKDLHSPFMKPRHWKRLMGITNRDIPYNDDKFCLDDLIKLELFKYAEDVTELVESAAKEEKIEKNINKIQKAWEGYEFNFKDYNEVPLLDDVADVVEAVEQDSMTLASMLSQKDVEEFRDRVDSQLKIVKTVDAVIGAWLKVQGNWKRLEPIFIGSEDIKLQLPDQAKRFEQIDGAFKELLRDGQEDKNVVVACTAEGRLKSLEEFHIEIEQCERSLMEYLGEKKKIFPRFYFASDQALLDILSNGNNPQIVDNYIGSLFDGLKCLEFKDSSIKPLRSATAMISNEGEIVPFSNLFIMSGAVENYLNDLEKAMVATLKDVLEASKATADLWDLDGKKRHVWLEDYCAQIALLATQIIWTEETEKAFDDLESGSETAMKDYFNLIVKRLMALIDRVRDPTLTDDLRMKIITIITIDVQERDVIDKFVVQKIADGSSFQWQQKLKFYMEKDKRVKDDRKVCVAKICDWQTYYNYEYVGNCGRLVITNLTDRCYITLTQALNLSMGGAPAGPAGTGKTETTKDLGRALGLMVQVFNCSDQMNYTVMNTIFMGLAQTGAWGCFDEFNRIKIEVLSVVSTQVKYVLDGIVEQKKNPAKGTFTFFEHEIALRGTVGFFITMNPGYAGRTELPENLKALFRSCAMVVPDITLICENMLMAEGFVQARDLSKKFMCLYDLSKSLLSKQIHYDWGLRAVKSVLRQAGGLKRDQPDEDERLILMRGLKFFNKPKIVVEDWNIFCGLIDGLFNNLEADWFSDPKLENNLVQAGKAVNLQVKAGEGLVAKAIQYHEILGVRHSVFLIGNPGCAKSTIWKTLAAAYNLQGNWDTHYEIIDPKAVTSNELYGFINPKTKDWKDGCLSVIMRNMKNCAPPFKETQMQKWLVLDGDVDPEWIETMNTVMDDNKVLTLVSQERIPLTKSMRLIIEVSNLSQASPATVSRGGVLFVNETDVGWMPYFLSWLSKYKKDDIADSALQLAQSNYMSESFMDDLKGYDYITPICDMQKIQSLTTIIDFLYQKLHTDKAQLDHLKMLKEEGKKEEIQAIYDAFFIFAGMWALGAGLNEDKLKFSGMWKSHSKIKFPENGQCFDFFFDPIAAEWVHWDTKVSDFNKEYEGLFQNLIVPTAETTRQSFLMDLHVQAKKGVLYVGKAGTGKTTNVKDFLATLNPDNTLFASSSFNSYTDSRMLQAVLEGQVGKRAGKNFGPPIGKSLIYFLDDLNMPQRDKYLTQAPICLIRQIIDYQLVYNREALEEQKFLQDVMFFGCMNPKSGSFTIDLRLSRHMTLVSCLTAEKEILTTIYQQILDNHMKDFDKPVHDLCPKIISATMQVFMGMANTPQFMPTAQKFHYQFNLRDFARIIQNMLLAQPAMYKGNPNGIIRMWAHECHRVWLDRLIKPEDCEAYMNFMKNALRDFGDAKEEVIFEEPNIYTSYVASCEGHEPTYMPIQSMDHLKGILEGKLEEYNEQVQSMDLVLFAAAMEHISRIARIVGLPCGSCLLVGVGGSGKQSLSKLTAFILGYEVMRIMVSTTYGMNDLKTDIQGMYQRAGVTGSQLLFIMTDGQIAQDRFLVYINDLLSSGWIQDLYPPEDLEAHLSKVRSEAKAAGLTDTPDVLFEFFQDKARKNLHICLCFSPVGDAFRFRARMFPGLINCTSIDWFHAWPQDALINVANRFLKDIEFPSEEIQTKIAEHMAFVHLSIDDANKDFLAQQRRNNYTTPTSFLELINFYKLLLGQKQGAIIKDVESLERGLDTMEKVGAQVEGLKQRLEVAMVEVAEEKKKTAVLIEKVNKESADASVEQEAADKQAAETNEAVAAAEDQLAKADEALAEAIPAMEAAKDAVGRLTKDALTLVKSNGNPTAPVAAIGKACIIVLNNEYKKTEWGVFQKMLADPNKFKDRCMEFNAGNIPDKTLEALKPIQAESFFNVTDMKKYSEPAANLCDWVNNVVTYNRIYKIVTPLKAAAAEADAVATAKKAELEIVLEKVRVITEKVDGLKKQLAEAEAFAAKVEADAQVLINQLDLANRLVGGLADEKIRWTQKHATLAHEKLTMIGDAVVSAAFVSYIGPFSADFRIRLWSEGWINDIKTRGLPFTEGVDPLGVLSTPTDHATWSNEGLPADRVSLENAAIVCACKRYPLIIDPQLQGQKWIKGKERELQLMQLTQDKWQRTIEIAVQTGQCLMIEAIGQEIDPLLDPLLSRAYVKKGRSFFVKIGSEDVELSSGFKLYLQTKLINPHYKPETAAQCTIINFIVTESGLEDQLLAMVVRVEKPELEQTKEELVNKQNGFKIELAKLEATLLENLVAADVATILENTELIQSLELTKETSRSIQEQQAIAVETETNINVLREVYRRVAAEGAMLYFLLIQLNVVDAMYQYSLDSFQTFFFKAIEKTESFEEEEQRVLALREVIRMTIYQWVSRGLFERHKQIFMSQMTFRLMQKKILPVEYTEKEMSFLLQCPIKTDLPNPLREWLPDISWYSMQKLIEIEGFENFATNVEKDAPNKFKDWYNLDDPENQRLPMDWKWLDQKPFQKLLVVRVLRPDRITTALGDFIQKTLPNGQNYTECDSTSSPFQILYSSYLDSTPATPIYFILSPGANPVVDVENLARKQGIDPAKFLHTVALGDGQDVVALNYLEQGHKDGHWVFLQNIQLMPDFLKQLEKKLDAYALEGSNQQFRLFLSSDPVKTIPIGLLERSIKLTNEPPQGLKPNMKRAWSTFNREEVDEKDAKIKTILFALCYFHSVMLERRKFGPKGWNRGYPFSAGDLRDSAIVLNNYLELNAASGKIPWDDLKYIFGEIMYGGHITDDRDRRFCAAFLNNLMKEDLMDEAELFPFVDREMFRCPPNSTYDKYAEYIQEAPPETPNAYGLHSNAEIDFSTKKCIVLFQTLQEIQPQGGGGGEGGNPVQEKVIEFIQRVNDECSLDSNKLNIDEIVNRIGDDARTPFQNSFLQECTYMNNLISIIVTDLFDIQLAFKGELTMTAAMEVIMMAIFLNKVPATWEAKAFPSTRGLNSWLDNVKQRLDQLNGWKDDPTKIPNVTFLNRLFNPQSFLTAIQQIYAKEKSSELNKLYIQTHVLKYLYWDEALPPCKEGAYIWGFQVEGARWDAQIGQLEDSAPKKNFSVVPVVQCCAAPLPEAGKEEKNLYECPVYKTEMRGMTYVFPAYLKTKQPPAKWIIAGVAIILDVEGISDSYAPGKLSPLQ